ERRDACAARADALGERALRIELDLELAREVLLGEQLVLAHVGRDHPLDLLGLEQKAQARAVDARVVGDDGEILHPGLADRLDQLLGDAAQAEAAGADQHAVLEQAGERRLGVRINLFHETRPQPRYGIAQFLYPGPRSAIKRPRARSAIKRPRARSAS